MILILYIMTTCSTHHIKLIEAMTGLKAGTDPTTKELVESCEQHDFAFIDCFGSFCTKCSIPV